MSPERDPDSVCERMRTDEADLPLTLIDNADPRTLLLRNLRQLASRVRMRVDVIVERDGGVEGAITGRGIGISYLFARDIAGALEHAANVLEGGNPCLRSVTDGKPCCSDADNLRRCTICGFIVDTKYAASMPMQP